VHVPDTESAGLADEFGVAVGQHVAVGQLLGAFAAVDEQNGDSAIDVDVESRRVAPVRLDKAWNSVRRPVRYLPNDVSRAARWVKVNARSAGPPVERAWSIIAG
jgi:hypothetical protein